MPAIKAISGHTGLAAARRYLERDGRALARDLLHFSRIDEATRQSGRGVDAFDWDVAMDETRRANGNDAPWRGRPARTYKHYVLSPDPRDGVSLEELRKLAVRWAEESFPDFQVAIVYHDDNEGRIPHAHVVVNNTNLATGNRLRDPDPGLLNGRLQAIARDMGLSHFEGRIDAGHPDTRKRASRENYQRVHVGRAEAELSSRGAYSWVADIRSRVDIAIASSRTERELLGRLSRLGIEASVRSDGSDWTFSLADQPSRRVSGTRLGTDYRRTDVLTRLAARHGEALLPDGSVVSVEEAARRAIELRDFSELRGLSSAVAVIEETRARSVEELAAVAARCGDPGERERIDAAIALARRHAMLPERRTRPRVIAASSADIMSKLLPISRRLIWIPLPLGSEDTAGWSIPRRQATGQPSASFCNGGLRGKRMTPLPWAASLVQHPDQLGDLPWRVVPVVAELLCWDLPVMDHVQDLALAEPRGTARPPAC